MATIEQVKEIFNEFTDSISEGDEDAFEFKPRSQIYVIKNSDVDIYLAKKDSLDTKIETRITSENYFEQ